MVVSAVDLLYVFGRYLVLSDHVTLMISSLGSTVVFLQQCCNNVSVFILV